MPRHALDAREEVMTTDAAPADEERPPLPFEQRLDLLQAMIRAYAPMVTARYLMGLIIGGGIVQIQSNERVDDLQAVASTRFATKMDRLMLDGSITRAFGSNTPTPEIQKVLEAVASFQTIVLFDRELDRAIILWDRDIGDVVDEIYAGNEATAS